MISVRTNLIACHFVPIIQKSQLNDFLFNVAVG